MDTSETIEELYKRKFNWMPENIRNEIGHFNIFRLEPLSDNEPREIPYRRRDFYKIMLVVGNSKVHYADKIIEVKKQALAFSNPQIPYKWEHLDNIRDGAYCIFNKHFFNQFGNPDHYRVFQPDGTHVFELTDEEVLKLQGIFERMFEELNSEYIHKYDVLRNLVFELMHFAMKMQSDNLSARQPAKAAQRISAMFVELLERQFPIEEAHPRINFRSASDFASQLNVHVNHLNRAVKEITQKTTSQLIAERVLREAKVLLRHSNWNVSEIADALGFTEVTHFNNFFRKHTGQSPGKFRNV
ncbi:AraC family transcriptional regulator [Emticicia sp. 21SJ11W-3]|uniref:helix-turn-helix domain-containing protein n=1 Tax=Emticicia sp. 21SJ11W-3 TaxID=2916755 RepID=UPI00209E7A54|nr:AraC family transcriptional regulator [Emticicia sp. 21SJ11W-3]UTA66380.1 helix-turn-helix transcriptional regulator [Emticicia sp. 21SJ11W-3]